MSASAKPAKRRFKCCYFVYILANLSGLLYTGLTDDIRKRIIDHKSGRFEGFTKKYKIDRLMYFETYGDPKTAAKRELQVKKYRKQKKIALFAESNPDWKDLTPELFQTIGIPPLRKKRSGSGFQKKSPTTEESLFHPGELESL